MTPLPQITRSNYISSMVTPYNLWFTEFGYPELDVIEYPDGEKAIIEYLKAPVVPSLTPWNFVLTRLRNQDLTRDWLKATADELCIEKRTVWEQQAKLEQRALDQEAEAERRAQDFADRAHAAIVQNDALMQRVARNGLKEINPLRILNHIPRSKLGKQYRERA